MPRVTSKSPLVQINTTPQEPPPPSNVETKEEKPPLWFWDLINDIPAPDWGKVYDVLVFRLGDSKVPMQPGEKGYLDMFTQPFSIADIRSRYGGGKFRLILEKNSRYKNTHDIEIEGAPIYDMRRERPGAAPAAAHAAGGGDTGTLGPQLLAMLREEMARYREEIAHTRDKQDSNPATQAAIELIGKGAEKAMDMMKDNAAGGGGGNIVDTIRVLKELGLVGQPATGGGMIETIKVLKELGLIGGVAGAAAVNPADQLTQFLTVFEKLDALRGTGGGGGGKRDWKETLAEKAMEHAPELINVFRETRDSNLQRAQAERDRANAQRQTAEVLQRIPPAAPNGAAQPAHASPQGAEPTHSAPVSVIPMRTVRLDGVAPQEPASVETIDNAFDGGNPAFVEWIKRRLVELVKVGQSGESIVDWLDGSLPGYSEQFSAAPTEMVTSFMRADPILAEAAEHPRWPEVLAEAREYLKENEALVN